MTLDNMTLTQFKTFSDTEKQQLIDLYSTHAWDFKYPLPKDLFDTEYYMNQRFEARKKKPDTIWPENLSKKEKVLCKIAMLRRIMAYVSMDRNSDSRVLGLAVITFLKDLEQEIFGNNNTSIDPPTQSTGYNTKISYPKFEGLDPEIAKVLNALYKSLSNSYKKPIIIHLDQF